MYPFFQLYFDEITFDALGSSQALFSFSWWSQWLLMVAAVVIIHKKAFESCHFHFLCKKMYWHFFFLSSKILKEETKPTQLPTKWTNMMEFQLVKYIERIDRSTLPFPKKREEIEYRHVYMLWNGIWMTRILRILVRFFFSCDKKILWNKWRERTSWWSMWCDVTQKKLH